MVRQIFNLCLAGNGPTKITRILTEQNIPTPGTMEYRRTGSTCRYYPGYECSWSTNTVCHILERREYIGDTVNFKTEKVSYKVKTTVLNPEEKQAFFEHTHDMRLRKVIQFDNANPAEMCRKQGLSADIVIGWKPPFCVRRRSDG